MRQHVRLSSYVGEEQDTISMEGLFGLGGPSDPKLKRTLTNNARTIGNKSWVTRRLAPRASSNERIINAVSYRGKTYTDPANALKKAGSLFANFLTKYRSRLNGYHEDLMDILQWGGRLMDQNYDPNVVGNRMVAEIGKHPLPLDAVQRYTEFFGTTTWTPGEGFGNEGEAVGSVDQLPALTANQIVAAAKVINDQTTWISKFQGSLFLPGTNINQDAAYAKLGKSDSRSDIADLFGNTGEPRKQFNEMQKGIKEWLNFHAIVMQWLNSQLNDSVSTESIDEDDFMSQSQRLREYMVGEQISTEGLQDKSKDLPKIPNKQNMSLESVGPRLAQYFDSSVKSANSDPRAALFGTVESNWRAELMPMLECATFNPVVEKWDAEAQAQEELVKRTASAIVFVITPKHSGFYSFVEITDMAIRHSGHLFVAILDNDEGVEWGPKHATSIGAIKTYLKNECGVTVYETLEALAESINAEVEPVSTNGSLEDPVSTEGIADFFKGKKSTPTNQEIFPNPDKKRNPNLDWIYNERNDILRTYGNPSWVAGRVTGEAIDKPELVKALSLNGKLPTTPQAALQEAKKITSTFVRNSSPRLNTYKQALAQVIAEAKATFVGKTLSREEQNEAVRKLVAEAKAVPPPFKDDTVGPKYFGGRTYMVITDGQKYADDKSFTPAKGPLPALTEESIVATAKLLISQYDEIRTLIQSIPSPGADPEDMDDYELPEAAHEQLEYAMGQLGRPGHYRTFVWMYCHLWLRTLEDVGRWLYASCSKEVE